jgi:hypothetical protein
MNITFTGTQKGITHLQHQMLKKTLQEINTKNEDVVLLHGDCIGADAAAGEICEELNIPVHIYNIVNKRAYSKYNNYVHHEMPPLERNRLMVDFGSALIACPGEKKEILRSGTWTTIRYARRVNKPIIYIWPDGTREVVESVVQATGL